MWINPCAQVIFDSDPAPKDTSGAAALEMMSQAMIRSVVLLSTLVCSLLPLFVFEIGYDLVVQADLWAPCILAAVSGMMSV